MEDKPYLTAQEICNDTISSEDEFEAIGISELFNDENDQTINWEDFFELK